MAIITTTGTAGLDLRTLNLNFRDAMTLTAHSATGLDWVGKRGGEFSLGGAGIVAVLEGDVLTDITRGRLTDMDLEVGVRSLHVTDWDIAAPRFQDLVAGQKWHALSALMLSGDDIVIGTAAKDFLMGGAGQDYLAGQAGDDWMSGGAAVDFLKSGAGNDTMIGGDGADIFQFDLAPREGGVDHIQDFRHRVDMIVLENDLFPNIGPPGFLDNHWFYTGDPAREGRQGIFYTQATGEIFSDGDGIGPMERILFAVVTPGTVLSGADFMAI